MAQRPRRRGQSNAAPMPAAVKLMMIAVAYRSGGENASTTGEADVLGRSQGIGAFEFVGRCGVRSAPPRPPPLLCPLPLVALLLPLAAALPALVSERPHRTSTAAAFIQVLVLPLAAALGAHG